MKKIIKKILYFLPFIIALIILYGTISGKTDKIIARFLKDDNKNDVFDYNDDISIVYEEGKIDLKKSFKFYIEPSEDYYDTENKVAKSNAYGITKNETVFKDKYGKKLVDYDARNSLDATQKGNDKYNKDCVKNIGEEIDIEFYHVKARVYDVSVSSKITKEDLDKFLPEYEDIVNYIGDDDKILPMNIIKKKGDEEGNLISETESMDICYVTAKITYNSYSEWIQNTQLAPSLVYLNEFDNRLEAYGIDDGFGYYSESKLIKFDSSYYVSFSPWFYDYEKQKNETCSLYPMIKGEEYTIEIGYLVPKDYLDDAYLLFSQINMENSYNNIGNSLVKLKQ